MAQTVDCATPEYRWLNKSEVSRFQVYWSATLPHKSPHDVANAQVNAA